MAEPVTLVVGGYLFKLVSDVACNMIAGRADARLQAFLDRRVNHDIQDALRKAWKAACAELFQRYREAPSYGSLRRDERELVKARSDLFVAPATIEALFPSSPDTTALTVDDVNRLFNAGHDEVNQALLGGLTRLGLLGDLPGGLERQIRDALLNGLLFHFVEVGIKRDPKARDAIFFDQLLAIRLGTAATEDELRAMRAGLEQLDGYQQWQREVLVTIDTTTRATLETAQEVNTTTKATHQTLEEIKERFHPPPVPLLLAPPTPPPDFKGRDEEIEQLVHALIVTGSNGPAQIICGVRGLGGIGKTILAAVVADKVKHVFSEQLFLDLRGTTTPTTSEDALRQVLRAFGREADAQATLAELEGMYRSLLHDKHVLILADNAQNARQVKPLMPPAGNALLITSRNFIQLPGMPTPIELKQMSEPEAVALVQKICTRLDDTQARNLAKLCGYLPLALRISAKTLAKPIRSIERYLLDLANEHTRLQQLHGDGAELDVESSFNLSYTALSTDAQALLRQLSVFTTSFRREASAQMIALPSSDAHVFDTALEELFDSSLLNYDETTNRYDLHDLVRVFALDRLREEGQETTLRLRHAELHVAAVMVADDLFQQHGNNIKKGLALFDAERTEIDAAWMWLRSQSPSDTIDDLLIQYADAALYIGDLRYNKKSERIPQLEAARRAAQRKQDRMAEGRFLGNLGNAYTDLGDLDQSSSYHEQHLAIAREISDRFGEGSALGNLGNAYRNLGSNIHEPSYTHGAIECHKQQIVIAREIGNQEMEGGALYGLGNDYLSLNDTPQAFSHYQQAAAIFMKVNYFPAAAGLLNGLGLAFQQLGEEQRAIECYEQSRTIALDMGDRRGESVSSWNLGMLLARQSKLSRAIELMQVQVDYLREIEHPDAEKHAGIVEQLRQLSSNTSISEDNVDEDVARPLLAFLNAQSLEEMREIFEAHPQLENEAVEPILNELYEQYKNDENTLQILAFKRQVLRDYWEHGIEATFKALMEVPAPPELEELIQAVDQYRTLRQIAIENGVDVVAWQQATAVGETTLAPQFVNLSWIDWDAIRMDVALDYNRLALAQFNAGDKKTSLESLERAIALHDDATFQCNKAGVLIDLERFDDAAAAIERARVVQHDAAWLAQLEAELAQARGDKREAGGA